MKRRGNGEGTLFKRKDGRWMAQTYATLVDGTIKRICVTNKDREVAKSKLRELQKQQDNRIPYTEKDWTVGEYLDYWMNDVQAKRIRETTMAIYSLIIKKFIKPAIGNQKLKALCVHNVRFAMDMLEKRGCSARTMLECLRILSACLNCAMREEIIFRNVAQLVDKPKYIPKETVIWTAEQASLFLQVNKNHSQYIAFLLLLTYGMCRGELLGLRWSDIDFDNGLIHLRQQIDRINGKIAARDLKTANSHRTLQLRKNIRTALLEHAKKSGVLLPQFNPHYEISPQNTIIKSKAGTPLEPRSLGKTFDILTKKAGLPRIKIHAMRHTAATILKDLNVPVKDVQKILGHANISTTLIFYEHDTPETQCSAIDAVENRLLGNHKQALPA